MGLSNDHHGRMAGYLSRNGVWDLVHIDPFHFRICIKYTLWDTWYNSILGFHWTMSIPIPVTYGCNTFICILTRIVTSHVHPPTRCQDSCWWICNRPGHRVKLFIWCSCYIYTGAGPGMRLKRKPSGFVWPDGLGVREHQVRWQMDMAFRKKKRKATKLRAEYLSEEIKIGF